MNQKAIVLNKLFFFNWAFLLIAIGGFAQTQSKNEAIIQGKLLLDSIWEPVVYLSHIKSFNDMYTMSNEMIIAEASVDSSGSFSFMPDYFPKDDQLFRVHVSKKGAPAASLIIGGKEENHLFIIANNTAVIMINSFDKSELFGKFEISGYKPNASLIEIDLIESYRDSTRFNGSTMKKEFVTRAINEKLRFVADTSSHPLVSLYALHKSKFESNFPINQQFYKNYLERWKGERSTYFSTFRSRIPIAKNQNIYYYILLGTGFFVLGFFLNQFLSSKRKKNKNQLRLLSVQERKIFNLIKLGRSNKEISEEYSIGLSTVKSHVSSIYTKLNVKSRKEAMDF